MESIAKDSIQVDLHASDWSDSIVQAARPLVERGSIEVSYVDRMIGGVTEFGPYIVIMPGLALAHAAPGDDVHVSDLSIATFTNDVVFHSGNDPVRIVMCLACRDREAHIVRLQGIAEKLMEDGFLDRLRSCANGDELYQLING